MQLVEVEYICQECGEIADQEYSGMICQKCGGRLRGKGGPSISGTRDGFGIKKSFRDCDGNEVDSWKKWERAGYKNPLEVTKNNTVKEKIKENIKRRKKLND